MLCQNPLIAHIIRRVITVLYTYDVTDRSCVVCIYLKLKFICTDISMLSKKLFIKNILIKDVSWVLTIVQYIRVTILFYLHEWECFGPTFIYFRF